MTQVRVGPKIKNPTHDLALETDTELIGLKLDGGQRALQEVGQTPSTVDFGGGKNRRWGTGDPTFTEVAQSTWHGGRGSEFFHDDETRYFDSWQAMTRVPGRLMPQLRWKFASGYRVSDHKVFGDMSWHQLRGDERYITTPYTCAANLTADKAYMWIRRRGSPGTLTFELCSDSSGDPDSVLQTVTKTTADITDTISVWQVFDWTGTEATTATTVYHLKVYGASTDSAANHWELGVDESGSASKTSAAGSSWTAASYTAYYRVVGADVPMKWHFFTISDVFHAISEKSTGDSTLFEWDETNDDWDAVVLDAGDALSGTVKSVAVSKDIAHCARGSGAGDETIWTFTNVSGTATGQDDATAGNKADLVLAYNDPGPDGPQICRFENATWYWSRSAVKARDTDLVFGTDVAFPEGFDALSMVFYNGQVWVRTTDGVHSIANDRPSRLDVGLDAVLEPDTSKAPMLAKDLFLYLAWSYSLERLYGGTLDDIGPWKGAGLPMGRQGVVSCLCSGIGGIYVGIDGGTGNTSCVLFTTNGRDYEEVFRGWEAGQRVRNIHYQPQNGTTSPARLWISVGEDLVYIDLPDQSMNPLHDTDSRFVHEYAIASPTHDFEAVHMPKFFKALEASSDNLGTTCDIGVDYQVDADVGSSTWTELTNLYVSPHDVADLNLGNCKQLRYRLRCNTSDGSTPPVINAVVVTGFTRTKYKRQWNLRVKVADLQRTRTGAKDIGWSKFYAWAMDATRNATSIRMRTGETETDGTYVIIDPGGVFRKFSNSIQGWVGGTWAITLREA